MSALSLISLQKAVAARPSADSQMKTDIFHLLFLANNDFQCLNKVYKLYAKSAQIN